ncbi:MAG TPA: hypothetical protein PKC28_00280 [Bdellovibrionales bacterium]|nr:hypothetical protein [Bdellovibrionales bacterium]
MNRLLSLTTCLAAVICLSGCRQEDPNPELKDPIFKDLETRAAAHLKAVEEGKAQIAALKESMAKTEPNSIDMKNVRRDLAKTEKKLIDDDQMARFFKIRAARRKVEGRLAYREAFLREEEWPKPSEYSDYLVNIRLRSVPLNWNTRVPKLQARMPSAAGTKPQKKPESDGEAKAAD